MAASISRGPSLYDVFDIEADFTSVYQTVPRIREAPYVLIGENHTRSWARNDQTELITHLVTPGSILLVEGCAALVEVTGEHRERIMRLLKISEYAQSMLTLVGWDRLHNMAKSNTPTLICGYHDDTGESFVISDEINANHEKFFGSYRSELELITEDESKLSGEGQELLKELKEEYLNTRIEGIAHAFPDRTETMVYTLKTLEEERLQGRIKGKIFLIAGLDHLHNKICDSRFSLKLLYDLLPQLPVTVVYSNIIASQRGALEEIQDRPLLDMYKV